MKRRVKHHKVRCEVEQYHKLYKGYGDFSWTMIGNSEIKVPYFEYNRRFKKMVECFCSKTFRSSNKALNYGKRILDRDN